MVISSFSIRASDRCLERIKRTELAVRAFLFQLNMRRPVCGAQRAMKMGLSVLYSVGLVGCVVVVQ